jgi:hypothetical protein
MTKLALLLGIFLLASCSDGEGTTKLLEDQGYTNIVIKGYDHFSCHEDDTFATEFEATSPSGHIIHGTVCRDVCKGSYIRFH